MNKNMTALLSAFSCWWVGTPIHSYIVINHGRYPNCIQLRYSRMVLYVHSTQSIQRDVNYSNEALDFFIGHALRDKRDLSSYYAPRIGAWTKFSHLVHKYALQLGITGGLKGRSWSRKVGLRMVKDIAIELWRSLDTDLTHTLADLAEIDDTLSWRMIIQTKVDPTSPLYHNDSDLFYRDYQAVSFIRKYEGLDIGVNTKLEALKSWIKAEEDCYLTNMRFTLEEFTKDERMRLFAMKKFIQRVLGPCPSITDVCENARFGPGASTSIRASFSSIFEKIDRTVTTGAPAFKIAERFAQKYGNVFQNKPDVSDEKNLLTFVPKTALVGRPVQVPEDYPVLLQLGLASLLRNRLKKWGLDLDTQADRNGEFARLGSIDQSFATTDLTSASDTISYMVVKALLPTGWFNLLNALRARSTTIVDPDNPEQSWVWRNNKFSAMGNGYTFELESLIFLAATVVGCNAHHDRKHPNDIGVFGDDLCFPTKYVETVHSNLTLLGFTINLSKSYSAGPFRESCGQDYFLGAPVRPYFQKKEVTDVTHLYSMANGIRRVSARSLINYGCDSRYRPVWDNIIRRIKPEDRSFGPAQLGDSVIWGNPSDGCEGEYAVNVSGCWNYRIGPIKAHSRKANIYAYSGQTLMLAWLLQSHGFTPKAFDKDAEKLRQFLKWAKSPEAIEMPWTREPTVLQRTLRKDAKQTVRFARSVLTALIQSDCPPFR